MKIKALLVGGAVTAAVIALPGVASADVGDKVTGGGQILVGTSGAGSTIAFTAQENADTTKGQVQIVDRSAGTGQAQEKFHGIVDCVEAVDNTAVITGYQRGDEENRFFVGVQDNGEGSNAESDLVYFETASDLTCGDEFDEDSASDLARGNAQVRDGQAGSDAAQQQSAGFGLLGLSAPQTAITAPVKLMTWRHALRLAGMKAWRR